MVTTTTPWLSVSTDPSPQWLWLASWSAATYQAMPPLVFYPPAVWIPEHAQLMQVTWHTWRDHRCCQTFVSWFIVCRRDLFECCCWLGNVVKCSKTLPTCREHGSYFGVSYLLKQWHLCSILFLLPALLHTYLLWGENSHLILGHIQAVKIFFCSGFADIIKPTEIIGASFLICSHRVLQYHIILSVSRYCTYHILIQCQNADADWTTADLKLDCCLNLTIMSCIELNWDLTKHVLIVPTGDCVSGSFLWP